MQTIVQLHAFPLCRPMTGNGGQETLRKLGAGDSTVSWYHATLLSEVVIECLHGINYTHLHVRLET